MPAGARHNLINLGEGPLLLYTLHAPPEHLDDTVHKAKSDAVQQVPTLHLRPTSLSMAALSGVSLSQ